MHASCLISDKMKATFGSTQMNTNRAELYLSQFSDLPQESLFKHGWVNLWCWLGFDRRVWERKTNRFIQHTLYSTSFPARLCHRKSIVVEVLKNVMQLCNCLFTHMVTSGMTICYSSKTCSASLFLNNYQILATNLNENNVFSLSDVKYSRAVLEISCFCSPFDFYCKIKFRFCKIACSIYFWPAGGRRKSSMLPWGPAEGQIPDNAPTELPHEHQSM